MSRRLYIHHHHPRFKAILHSSSSSSFQGDFAFIIILVSRRFCIHHHHPRFKVISRRCWISRPMALHFTLACASRGSTFSRSMSAVGLLIGYVPSTTNLAHTIATSVCILSSHPQVPLHVGVFAVHCWAVFLSGKHRTST